MSRYPKKPQKGVRKLVLESGIWWWRKGRNVIQLWGPNGFREVADIADVSGWSWDSIERGTRKRYFSLKPQQVRDYIERTCI